ncbi:MAG TPA: GspE/PulE family protein [Methylomirabilota bacterium]|nr:GspE/PulE family protein [Methylomirabilota bacterium]
MLDTLQLDEPGESPSLMSSEPKKRLGERLIEAGLLSQSQLDLALREQKRKGGLIGQILVELGFTPQEVISSFVGQEASAKVVNVSRAVIERAVLQLVPFEILKRFRALPLSQEDHTLTVALANPSNVVAIDTLQQVTGLGIEVVTAPERDILNSLELHYHTGGSIEESIDEALDQEPEEARVEIELPDEQARLGFEDAPIIRLVDQIIARAVQNRASDIHIEPEERILRIRTRIDGVLFQDVLIPKSMQSAVVARLKIMADLDVAEQRLPQDGRATVFVGRRELSLRVSSLPSAWGENIVLRILDSGTQSLTLPGVGFSTEDYQAFLSAVKRPYGVVLVTGPTGSGKTTTLYAALKEISTMEVSVFTLEDPIEYRMPVIRQTQIKEEIGLTFGAGLRALLRQDPDVILVGETRDTETAQLMVRAALTGHLVLSTLHTNDSAGAIPRLIDMGVEPYLLPASLIAIMAQRLVRTICPECKEPVEDPGRVFEELKLTPPANEPLALWKGRGCPACNASGYRGRQGIFELMPVDERFHEPIVRRAGAPEYLRLARERGMRTMFEDGLRKVVRGATTIEELLETTRLVEG